MLEEAYLARLFKARHIAVLTGAGVSAESGVPTFRDAQTGLWATFRPEDLATPEAFARNPRMVWEWYDMRRRMIAQVKPNPGHLALVALEAWCAARGADFTLITQNVDGLHRTAGSQNILELHGNLLANQCFECHQAIPDDIFDTLPLGSPPACPCGKSNVRPAVVWFGEMLPPKAIQAASRAAKSCDVFLSIGTSTQVYPAAQPPFDAKVAGALVIEINADDTPLTTNADVVLRGASGVVLPKLLEQLVRHDL